MQTLLINAAAILTVSTDGLNCKRGEEMRNPGILENHALLIEDGIIADFIPTSSLNTLGFAHIINLHGKTILPGLIDCHTHSVFAGSRAGEFCMKLGGSSYEEVAKQGGGIRVTMDATRKASADELLHIATKRIMHFVSLGVTTVEIKSGYGLNYDDEIKILQVIKTLQSQTIVDIIPTFLGAHIVPPEYNDRRDEYLCLLIDHLIPYIAQHNLAKFCDVFCEESAFTAEETNILFKFALQHGLVPKIHTEQFHSIGGLETALTNNAISVDHLEVLQDAQIESIAKSQTTAVLLPGVSFFLKHQFAPARGLIDASAIVALATDFNPGSSHIPNMHLIMVLAALNMGMTIEETIAAATINAANAVGMQKITGSLEIGKQADIAVLDTDNYKDLIYTPGQNLNCMTIKKGKVIFQQTGNWE